MYDKQSIRVLAGGLNLALPGDVLSDEDSQELVNFSTDSLGALRSRRGHTLVCTAGGSIINQIRGLGARWQADGGSVSRACSAIIGSSGTGLLSWKDHIWAASPMRKSDGASDFRWIAEAPTAAPTIKPAAAAEKDVVTFDPVWVVDPGDDETEAETYDPTLTIRNSGASVWMFEKPAAQDLFSNHSLDDVHKISVFSNRWHHVTGITFEVDVNDGTFEKDLYRGIMTPKNIKVGRKAEVSFYIRKRPLPVDKSAKDKKHYPSFERIGSTAEKDWRSVVAVRIKVEFNDNGRVRFNSWKNIGDVDNTLEGDDFRACYTYDTDDGHESNPSPFSEPITVNRTGIDVEGIAVSGDPQVTRMNIYLTGGTLQAVYRVNAEAVAQATTYQIRQSDDDLTGLNLQLEADHDDPPEASGLIGPYYGRAIAFNGNRYYWSHTNKPYAFAAPDDESGGDWAQIEEGLGDILAATMRPGTLWFHCENGVSILQGDPGDTNSSQHRASAQGGIQSRTGVVQAPDGDYQARPSGVFRFTGDAAEEISRKIQPAFKGGWNSDNAAIGFGDNVICISDRSRTFRWDRLVDRWFEDSRMFSNFYWDGGSLLGGTPDGKVLELESSFTDDGAAIPVAWTSKSYNCGLLDSEKTFEDVTIWADTSGADLTVTALLEDGATSVALGTISSGSKERFVLQMNGAFGVKARNIAIRITGAVSGECVIHEVALNFYVEAREAKSFDSDERDDNTHRMKEIMEVYVDLHSPSAAQLIIQSDQPSFEMATRDDSHSFGASATRRGDMYVLETSVLAHNYRVLLDGEEFRLYGMKILEQIIGTLLHGSRGEFYRSDPLGFGEERVKLYKEIHVEYCSDAAASLKVETELPDGTIAEVDGSPFTLTGTGGIRWRDIKTAKIRLRNTAKGRLILTTITPDGDFRLETLKVFLKVIGSPGASSWGWTDFPVEKTQPAAWQEIPVPVDSPG